MQASNLLAILPPSLPSQAVKVVTGQNALLVTGRAELVTAFESFIVKVDALQPPPSVVVLPIRYVKPEDLTNRLMRLFPQYAVQYLQG